MRAGVRHNADPGLPVASGVALADVVAQVRARYAAEGRTPPRFSETLLSAYESAQKRPGPEYLHYLCAVYQTDPEDLGYQGPCLCGNRHGRQHPETAVRAMPASPPAAVPSPGRPDVGDMGQVGPRGATARRAVHAAARP